MAVGVALAAGTYAIFNSYFYPKVPLHEGDRLIALVKWDARVQNDDGQLLHDLMVWRRELRSVVDIGAFRTVGRRDDGVRLPRGTRSSTARPRSSRRR
jgi:hypothetical protein